MAKFRTTLSRSIANILTDILNGKFPVAVDGPSESSLFGDGVSVNLGENSVTSATPRDRNIVSMAPRATILIKKKAFSTMKQANDLQWMDRTERMLLRATKALFAYKVAQIRAYESLSKIEDTFQDTGEISLNLFVELLDQAKLLSIPPEETGDIQNFGDVADLVVDAVVNSLSDIAYDSYKEDVLKILERHAFSTDNHLTNWVVDPNNTDNYLTGPGTGVIELGTFKSFSTQTSLESDPQTASIEIADPYRIMNIIEDDIEMAIEEALTGTLGLMEELVSGNPDIPLLDTQSILASAVELSGLGQLDSTLDTDYIRDRLRVFYLGKSIINAADGVHFFIRGNKGLNDYRNEEEYLDESFFQIDETILEAERILYTNGSLPRSDEQGSTVPTYKQLRKFSDNSLAMRHVFAGYVTRISESFGGGQWTLKIDCVDNMGWLQWSRFMIEPALQDPQGILEDPLTPFKIDTDATGEVLSAAGPELLDENKDLLRTGLLSYDSGILNGQVATENNLLQGQYNQSGSLNGTKCLQHPHGLIYRWKTGIITATAAVNTVDPLDESEITQRTHNQVYGLTVAEDVLNNLDIANILSLLIVGQPYNVETFVDQAYQVHNITKTASSTLSPQDPLASVLDVVRRQNNYFGDFRPYRMITMSNSTIEQTAGSNFMRNEVNDKVKQLQVRRAEINSVLRRLKGAKGDGSVGEAVVNGTLTRSLEEEVRRIDAGIKAQIDSLRDSGSTSSADLVTSNFNLFGNNRVLPLTGNFTADHEITRAMTIIGAQRRIEDVRLNRDNNLFIVSDQYDEHTDIRPYLFKIRDSGYKIFQGQFIDVHTKCAEAARFMNLEFFCNSQGHLEFRPPQWNRTPLSILQRLFEINGETDKNIVPEFLTEIFETRTTSLRREIHSLNVRIVILALLLGRYPDGSLIPNFPNPSDSILIPEGTPSGKASLRFFGVREEGLKDNSEKTLELRDNTYRAGIGNLVDTGSQLLGAGVSFEATFGDEGDILNGDTETLLGIFDPVFQEEQNVVQNVLTVATTSGGSRPIKIANKDNLDKLRTEFKKSFGLDPARDLVTEAGKFRDEDFIFSSNASDQNAEANSIGQANNYLQKLEETISNRDKLVTILQRNIEKQEELEELENILSGEFTAPEDEEPGFLDGVIDVLDRAQNTIKTISDIFTGDSTKGSLFDHLIEDDTRNLMGPGSGRRYIIEDHDIITCTYVEQPPDFCRIDVVGDAPVIGSGLASTFEDRYYWAGATDFDLWRQYGYKYSEVNLPFANSAELQSKPYAILELQLQRVKIHQANVTVAGNEYYEPGDVVFLKDKQLLYYVRSVSHNFEIGSGFTTSLVLEFGHPPEIYLPSPLDIIGQQLTKDPLTGNILVYRNSEGDDNYRALQPDGAIIFPPNTEPIEANIPFILDHKDNAVRIVNMMIDLNTLLIGNRVVLIRGFVKGTDDPTATAVKQRIKLISSLLQNPVMLTNSNPNSVGDDLLDGVGSALSNVFGANTGTSKGTETMILPNGIPANPVPPESIVEQLVVMNKESNTSFIQCLNPALLQEQQKDGSIVNETDVESVFPKGGPKQRTWLDLRDDLSQVENIIEIGVLDIQRSLEVDEPAEDGPIIDFGVEL
jgi:hypothetical protein